MAREFSEGWVDRAAKVVYEPPRQDDDLDGFVICRAKMTAPVSTPAELAIGLTPNMECGLRVPVVCRAEVMQFRCPRGHLFYAREADVRGDDVVRQERRAA